MSKRSQEGLSDDSSTVKAKSRAMNLVSYRNLSIARQNSQNASDSEFLVSDRTDKPSSSFQTVARETQVEVCLCVLNREATRNHK